MGKKHRKKDRTQRSRRPLPCFVFTKETLALAQKAVALFEEPLQRADRQDSRVAFAAEMIGQVKGKLERMQRAADLLPLTTFDYNEKIIMAQAIRLYMVELSAVPSNAQRALELQLCWQMVTSFGTS